MTRRGFFAMVAAAFAGRKAVAAAPVLMPYYAPPVLMQSPPCGGYTKPLSAYEPLEDFLSECCATGDVLYVREKDLYGAYRAWCSEFGECPPLSAGRFGERLQVKGFQFHRMRVAGVQLRAWSGITLKPLAEWREQDQAIWNRLTLEAR